MYSLLVDLVLGPVVVALLNLLLLMDDLISVVRLQMTFVEKVVCRQIKDESRALATMDEKGGVLAVEC